MARRKHHRRSHRRAHSHRRRHHRVRRVSAHQHKFGAKGKRAFDECLKEVGSGKVSATRSGWGACFRRKFKGR